MLCHLSPSPSRCPSCARWGGRTACRLDVWMYDSRNATFDVGTHRLPPRTIEIIIKWTQCDVQWQIRHEKNSWTYSYRWRDHFSLAKVCRVKWIIEMGERERNSHQTTRSNLQISNRFEGCGEMIHAVVIFYRGKRLSFDILGITRRNEANRTDLLFRDEACFHVRSLGCFSNILASDT